MRANESRNIGETGTHLLVATTTTKLQTPTIAPTAKPSSHSTTTEKNAEVD